MAALKMHTAVVSHKGCVRSNHEDNFFINGDYMPLNAINHGAVIEADFSDSYQLYAVLDGMGGAQYGERAATIAAQMMLGLYMKKSKDTLRELIVQFADEANRRIHEDCTSHHEEYEGTTLALLAIRDRKIIAANVGDSRVYRLRNHILEQLTQDHSFVGDMVRQQKMTAEQARKSPKNNLINQFLGMRAEEKPKDFVFCHEDALLEGDRYMVCSDGLCDMLSNKAICSVMQKYASPLACAKQLVLDAFEMGGKDNTTCIIVDAGKYKAP